MVVMDGAVGFGREFTMTGAEVTEQIPPLLAVTAYVPEFPVVMEPDVCPSDHVNDPEEVALKVTDDPWQKSNGPLADMTGVVGYCTTFTVVGVEDAEQPDEVTVTR